jgi:hypothetical protein
MSPHYSHQKEIRVMEHLVFNLSGRVRKDTLEGRPHLVVPTVMIVEGVLNGSTGALLYPADELSSTPYIWNHKPIVVGHPGGHTACEPREINTRKVGVILNTKWQRPKLRTEAWIDIERANQLDPRILENIKAGRPTEVSTGLTVDYDRSSPGSFNGKPYTAIARNFKPDHLAILFDATGASSVADGAGLLALNADGLAGVPLMFQLGKAPIGSEGYRERPRPLDPSIPVLKSSPTSMAVCNSQHGDPFLAFLQEIHGGGGMINNAVIDDPELQETPAYGLPSLNFDERKPSSYHHQPAFLGSDAANVSDQQIDGEDNSDYRLPSLDFSDRRIRK